MKTLIVTLCCLFFITAEAKSPIERANTSLDSAKRALEKVQGELGDLQKRIKQYELPKRADVASIDEGIVVYADPGIDPQIVHRYNQDGTPVRDGMVNGENYLRSGAWAQPQYIWQNNITGENIEAMPQQEMTIPADSIEIPEIDVPDIDIPEISTPEIIIPKIHVPGVKIPGMTVPGMTIPADSIEVPQMNVPAPFPGEKIVIPEINIPAITIPPMNTPDINIPEKHIKGMKIPKRHIKGYTIPKRVIPLPDDSK